MHILIVSLFLLNFFCLFLFLVQELAEYQKNADQVMITEKGILHQMLKCIFKLLWYNTNVDIIEGDTGNLYLFMHAIDNMLFILHCRPRAGWVLK